MLASGRRYARQWQARIPLLAARLGHHHDSLLKQCDSPSDEQFDHCLYPNGARVGIWGRESGIGYQYGIVSSDGALQSGPDPRVRVVAAGELSADNVCVGVRGWRDDCRALAFSGVIPTSSTRTWTAVAAPGGSNRHVYHGRIGKMRLLPGVGGTNR